MQQWQRSHSQLQCAALLQRLVLFTGALTQGPIKATAARPALIADAGVGGKRTLHCVQQCRIGRKNPAEVSTKEKVGEKL